MTDRSHTTRLPPMECPHCHVVHDAASDPNKENPAPKPGDLTICIECAGIAQFTGAMQLRLVSKDEWDEFAATQPATVAELRRQQKILRSRR